MTETYLQMNFNTIALLVIVSVIISIVILISVVASASYRNKLKGFLMTYFVILVLFFFSSSFQWVGLIGALLLIAIISLLFSKK